MISKDQYWRENLEPTLIHSPVAVTIFGKGGEVFWVFGQTREANIYSFMEMFREQEYWSYADGIMQPISEPENLDKGIFEVLGKMYKKIWGYFYGPPMMFIS